MAANMWLYWGARGHLTEGRRRLVALIEEMRSLHVPPRAGDSHPSDFLEHVGSLIHLDSSRGGRQTGNQV